MSTTELRNKMSEMVAALKQGKRVKIIHRSEVLGTITPEAPQPKKFDPEKFERALAKMKPRKPISHSAEKADCELFLTSDKELLKMKSFGEIKIVDHIHGTERG